MNRVIQAVLFDLGDTLMYSPDPWPPVFERAGRMLTHVLISNGARLDGESFHLKFLKALEEYYAERERNLRETSTLTILQHLLIENDQANFPVSTLRTALDEFYAITQQNWHLELDTIPMLEKLHNSGFHIGLISNAGDDRDVRQQVKNFGIEPYFDFILTSAACGYRKPHPYIFGLALNQWGYLPDEVAMVGDRLDADMGGAKLLGIYTIWIKRRTKNISPAPSLPDATVDELAQIAPLLINLPLHG